MILFVWPINICMTQINQCFLFNSNRSLLILKTINIEFDEDIDIKGITCNSKEVKKGYLFIAIKGNKTLGVICGIDFIYNEKDNKWYYLEIQAFPAIDEWAVTKGIKIPVSSINIEYP